MEPRTWRPVLGGPAREEALAAARDIAAALAEPAESARPSLAGGDAGEALFLAYLARALPDGGYRDLALARLERAVEALASEALEPSLCDGFAGVAWAASHVASLLGVGASGEDSHAEIDQALEKALARPSLDVELLYGISGIGVYYLERDPRAAARSGLERIVARLEVSAVDTGRGLAWTEAPWYHDPKEDGGGAPAGEPRFNLGVAHGVPGVVGLLAHALARGVAPDRTRALLQRAVGFLLHHKSPAPAASAFPFFVTPSFRPADPARSAWCYGDPGIAPVLLAAAQAALRPDWEQAALEVALRAAARPIVEAGVLDAALCHGAAGLGLIFARLHTSTGEAPLADAARRWFARALDLRQPGQGVGGFRAWMPEEGKEPWRDERGLLNGAAGIGLALLAAATGVEPAWDIVLLIAPPSEGVRS